MSFSLGPAYAVANLALATAYLMFRLTQKGLETAGPLRALRWGQGLIVTSLLASAGVHFLPRPVLPPIPPPLQEVSEKVFFRFTSIAPRPVPLPSVSPKERAAPQKAVPTIPWPTRLWGIFFFGLFVQWLTRVQRRHHLRTLLLSAVSIRRIGKVHVVVSSDISVPFSTYLDKKAWVVLPESLIGSWTDFSLAIRHELQHHRQKDTTWVLVMEGIVCFFYLNPFLYFWKKTLSEFQEFSCDEALIGRRVCSHEYGSCLVRVAEAALAHRLRLAGTASMAAGCENPTYFKSFLRRRIEMLNKSSQKGRRRSLAFLCGTLALFITTVVAYAVGQSDENKKLAPIAEGLLITDSEIQKIADKALEGALKRHKASLGFVVVADPNTGNVLAVANKDIAETHVERTPHWALSLRIGPASIAKVIVAAAAVEKKVTSFSAVHNCENGKYTWGGTEYRDWKGFGNLSTADMLIQSSNICGIKVGQELGADGIAQAFQDFGFGAGGTASNFPESRSGEIPAPRPDDPAYIATFSTGYGGIYVSPLELVQAFGAIANGGNLLKPQAEKGRPAEVIRRVISEDTARQTREVLAQVMTRGTARESESHLYRLGGKTATSYSHTHVDHDSLGGDSNMAAFIGFGPVEKPKVVVLAVVENPTDAHGVHGAYHAAPLFKEVAEKTLAYLKVPSKVAKK